MTTTADDTKPTSHSPVGMWRVGPEWESIEANEPMLNMLEVESVEKLRGAKVPEFLAPEVRADFRDIDLKRRAGIASTYETILQGRRGTRRHVLVSGSPVFDDAGKFSGAIAAFADISDLRHAESALRETMDRYRAVVTALGEGIIVVSRTGELVEINPSGRQILGLAEYSLSQTSVIPMQPTWRFTDEHGREISAEELPAGITFKTGQPIRNRLIYMGRPDGSGVWLNVNTQPLTPIDEGGPYACVVSFYDVTALKQAHDEVRRREARLERLLDAVPDLLFLIGSDGTYLDYRATRPELLFGPADEFLGKRMQDVLPPEVLEPCVKAFRMVVETGKTQTVEYSTDILGSMLYFEARMTPFEGGTVLQIVRDVTEARLAEQRIRQHEQERMHLARLGALGEMVAGISHEINQPLHAIANFAAASVNVLEAGGEGAKEQVASWLKKIANQAFRASEIVKRFRQFSSPVANISVVPISELVSEAIELVQGEYRRRNVKMELQNEAGDIPFLTDRVQIQQVLVNFLVNAGEAVEENPSNERRVFVRSKFEEGQLTCEVLDNGVGLPTVPTQHLFDAFFTTKPQGLGLGLAISRTIVESQGGRIWARHNNPRGAVFGFQVPQSAEVPARE